ncbi:ParE toxin of type II toxin-antitoxin system, parDE [uncultured archaeon]|nr:ParE toxin of type II toxin-antitoxin system, parDE [uncultured archaeon]
MHAVRYTLLFEKKLHEFRKDKQLADELKKKIEKLLSDPFIGKPLQYHLANYRSIRVREKYRLIYKINENSKEIILVAFGHRKPVYEFVVLDSKG